MLDIPIPQLAQKSNVLVNSPWSPKTSSLVLTISLFCLPLPNPSVSPPLSPDMLVPVVGSRIGRRDDASELNVRVGKVVVPDTMECCEGSSGGGKDSVVWGSGVGELQSVYALGAKRSSPSIPVSPSLRTASCTSSLPFPFPGDPPLEGPLTEVNDEDRMSPSPSTVVAGLSLPPTRTLSPAVLSDEAGEGFEPDAVGLQASCIVLIEATRVGEGGIVSSGSDWLVGCMDSVLLVGETSRIERLRRRWGRGRVHSQAQRAFFGRRSSVCGVSLASTGIASLNERFAR